MPPALGMQSLNHWIGREVPEMFSLLAGLHVFLLIPVGHTFLPGSSLVSGDSLPHTPPPPLSPPTQVPSTFPPVALCPSHSVARAPAVPAFVFCSSPVLPVPQTVLFLKSQLQACPCHHSFPLLWALIWHLLCARSVSIPALRECLSAGAGGCESIGCMPRSGL